MLVCYFVIALEHSIPWCSCECTYQHLPNSCTSALFWKCVSGGIEWSRQGQSHLEQTNTGTWSSDHWLLCAVQEKGNPLLHHSLSAWLQYNLIQHHQPQSWYSVWSESCIRGPSWTEYILLLWWEASHNLQLWVNSKVHAVQTDCLLIVVHYFACQEQIAITVFGIQFDLYTWFLCQFFLHELWNCKSVRIDTYISHCLPLLCMPEPFYGI